jgi:carbon storage regulator CsrA
MLVLSRAFDERIVITAPNGDELRVVVVSFRHGEGGDKVRLGIIAPDGYAVHRGEVQAAIKSEGGSVFSHLPGRQGEGNGRPAA